MKGEFYRRWLLEGRDLTLDEFVTECRALCRQQRAQRHMAARCGSLLQQAVRWKPQLDSVQGAPLSIYHGHSLGGALSSLIGGLFR